ALLLDVVGARLRRGLFLLGVGELIAELRDFRIGRDDRAHEEAEHAATDHRRGDDRDDLLAGTAAHVLQLDTWNAVALAARGNRHPRVYEHTALGILAGHRRTIAQSPMALPPLRESAEPCQPPSPRTIAVIEPKYWSQSSL